MDIKKVRIYDNNGESLDRYTVVIELKDEKLFYGMSEHATGFNMFLGSDKDGYEEGEHLGTIVNYDTMNDEVKTAIRQRMFQ